MNFFGGQNCGDGVRDNDCGRGFDCCSIIFLILLLQNCGCGFMKGGINIDCGTILLLLLLSNCCCKDNH